MAELGRRAGQSIRQWLEKKADERELDAKAETEAPENPRGPVSTRTADNQGSRVGIGGLGPMVGTPAPAPAPEPVAEEASFADLTPRQQAAVRAAEGGQGQRDPLDGAVAGLDEGPLGNRVWGETAGEQRIGAERSQEFADRVQKGIARREQFNSPDPLGRTTDPNFFLEEGDAESDIAAAVEDEAQEPEFTPGKGGWSYRDDSDGNIVARKADGSEFTVTPTTTNARGQNIYEAIRAEQQAMSEAAPAAAPAAEAAAAPAPEELRVSDDEVGPVMGPAPAPADAPETEEQRVARETAEMGRLIDQQRLADSPSYGDQVRRVQPGNPSFPVEVGGPLQGPVQEVPPGATGDGVVPGTVRDVEPEQYQLESPRDEPRQDLLVEPEQYQLESPRDEPQPLTMGAREIGAQESPDLDMGDRILVRQQLQDILRGRFPQTDVRGQPLEDLIPRMSADDLEKLSQVQVGGNNIGQRAIDQFITNAPNRAQTFSDRFRGE